MSVRERAVERQTLAHYQRQGVKYLTFSYGEPSEPDYWEIHQQYDELYQELIRSIDWQRVNLQTWSHAYWRAELESRGSDLGEVDESLKQVDYLAALLTLRTYPSEWEAIDQELGLNDGND